MIDSSALLLTIVMTTPVASHDTPHGDAVNISSLDSVMQRLCWPHTEALSMQCDDVGTVKTRQDEKGQNLIKALNSIQQNSYRR